MTTEEILIFITLYPLFYMALGYILLHLSKTSSGYQWFIRFIFLGYIPGAYRVLPGRDGVVLGMNDYPGYVFILAAVSVLILIESAVRIPAKMEKIEQNKIH